MLLLKSFLHPFFFTNVLMNGPSPSLLLATSFYLLLSFSFSYDFYIIMREKWKKGDLFSEPSVSQNFSMTFKTIWPLKNLFCHLFS
jgi:hypothetical protein